MMEIFNKIWLHSKILNNQNIYVVYILLSFQQRKHIWLLAKRRLTFQCPKMGKFFSKTNHTCEYLIRSVYILNMFKRTRWTNETKWICLMWDHNVIMFISSWATSADEVFYSKHYGKNWCVLLLSFKEIMGKCIVYNVTNNPEITLMIVESGNYL